MSFTVFAGLPGSGKSYGARELVRRLERIGTDPIYVASDSVRKELFANPTYSKEEHVSVFAEVRRRLTADLECPFIIYDATNLQDQAWQMIDECASEVKTEVKAVYFETPENVILERLANRINDDSDADASIFYKMRKYAKYPPGRNFMKVTPNNFEVAMRRLTQELFTESVIEEAASRAEDIPLGTVIDESYRIVNSLADEFTPDYTMTYPNVGAVSTEFCQGKVPNQERVGIIVDSGGETLVICTFGGPVTPVHFPTAEMPNDFVRELMRKLVGEQT